MAEKTMAIIVLNWNRLHYSKQTIECLMKKTTIPHYLVLVDNNSAEETGVRDYLKSVKGNAHTKEVICVFNGKNLGVGGGRDSGLYEVMDKRKLDVGYLANFDDDLLVPDNYDVDIIRACDSIPKLGIIGICVEPFKFPMTIINGVSVRVKKQGNINGIAIAMPVRTFKRVGYYRVGRGNLYGMEDSYLRYKLDMLGLTGYYLPKKGIHLDTDKDRGYRQAKNKAHVKKSPQLCQLSQAVMNMKKTGIIYTPYIQPEDFHPVDEDIFTNDMILEDRKNAKAK